MHSLTIKHPAKINESQAMQTAFEAFKHVMSQEGNKARIKQGLSTFVLVGDFECHVVEAGQGEFKVAIYLPNWHTPSATAICDVYDL